MPQVFLSDAVWSDVEEGTEALLDEWMVKVGDTVSEGQVMGVAELVKTSHEITAPVAGKVSALNVQVQATFGRGVAVAEIEP
ncbi:MAG: biotin attachment protein [Rhodocyclaceae bacterium]|nr:MAG: biotin attachment protein [Rhodocyclaceae bacterium]